MGATNPNAGGAPGGGGKGGMGMNRGPGGNAQNNPGQQITWGGRPYMGAGAWQGNMMPGLAANSTANSVGQSMGGPMGNFQSMMGQQIPWGSTPPKPFTFGGWNRPEMGGGTPIGNMTPPTPQPQEPVGGYINGQPAQWHYQAEALKNPPPRTNSVGLPSGGILAKLYGG